VIAAMTDVASADRTPALSIESASGTAERPAGPVVVGA
jgi:hypothetical protein